MLDAINTNIISLQTQDNLANSQSSLATSIQRLSSGLKINTAADDPAGLAIASRMQSQVNGLNQATQNANNGVSMLQTADGGLASTTSLLQSMRSLAVEAANGTNSSTDLASLQTEITQLQAQIGQVSSQTQYNGINLLDGSSSNTQFQVGANAGQVINVSIQSAATNALGSNQITSAAALTSPVAATANSTGLTTVANGQLTAQTISLTGTSPTATTVTTSVGESAQAVAAQINTSTTGGATPTGITATASTTATLTFGASGSQSITLGGGLDANGNPVPYQAISASYTAGSTDAYSAMANAINTYSATTGITATVVANNGGITLSNTTGADIAVTNQNTTAANTVSVTNNSTTISLAANATPGTSANATTVGGSISLSSATGFSVDGSGSATGFFSSGNAGSTLNTVASINVTSLTNGSPTGANQAIEIIDGAIQQIDTNRAQIGAYENRFTATISNLQTSTLNITSALSTVQDTNFASETANLSRGQILQQAGTAMLAQANSLPNGVLALLR